MLCTICSYRPQNQEARSRSCRLYGFQPTTWARLYRSRNVSALKDVDHELSDVCNAGCTAKIWPLCYGKRSGGGETGEGSASKRGERSSGDSTENLSLPPIRHPRQGKEEGVRTVLYFLCGGWCTGKPRCTCNSRSIIFLLSPYKLCFLCFPNSQPFKSPKF